MPTPTAPNAVRTSWICSGFGYLGMFLAEMLDPAKVQRVILLDKQWPMFGMARSRIRSTGTTSTASTTGNQTGQSRSSRVRWTSSKRVSFVRWRSTSSRSTRARSSSSPCISAARSASRRWRCSTTTTPPRPSVSNRAVSPSGHTRTRTRHGWLAITAFPSRTCAPRENGRRTVGSVRRVRISARNSRGGSRTCTPPSTSGTTRRDWNAYRSRRRGAPERFHLCGTRRVRDDARRAARTVRRRAGETRQGGRGEGEEEEEEAERFKAAKDAKDAERAARREARRKTIGDETNDETIGEENEKARE